MRTNLRVELPTPDPQVDRLTITHILEGGVVRGERRESIGRRRAKQGGDHGRDENGRRSPHWGAAGVWGSATDTAGRQQSAGGGPRHPEVGAADIWGGESVSANKQQRTEWVALAGC